VEGEPCKVQVDSSNFDKAIAFTAQAKLGVSKVNSALPEEREELEESTSGVHVGKLPKHGF
jgi:hypothetical protein